MMPNAIVKIPERVKRYFSFCELFQTIIHTHTCWCISFTENFGRNETYEMQHFNLFHLAQSPINQWPAAVVSNPDRGPLFSRELQAEPRTVTQILYLRFKISDFKCNLPPLGLCRLELAPAKFGKNFPKLC